MATGRTSALLEPSPAAMPLTAARTAARKTAAKVAIFVQSTRGVVSSAVAIRWVLPHRGTAKSQGTAAQLGTAKSQGTAGTGAAPGRPPVASCYRGPQVRAGHRNGN